MNIQSISAYSYQNNRYQYQTKPTFNGLFSKTKLLSNLNIGSLPDGIIGKIKVFDKNGKEVLFDVFKNVEDSGLEIYKILDKKRNILGDIEFKPTIEGNIKHIWVEHLVNHSSLYHKYRNESLGDYTGIGTRLMQIALKRSYETGCRGDIELFTTTTGKDFYRKIGLKDYLSEYSYFQDHRMYLPEENKRYLAERYGGL